MNFGAGKGGSPLESKNFVALFNKKVLPPLRWNPRSVPSDEYECLAHDLIEVVYKGRPHTPILLATLSIPTHNCVPLQPIVHCRSPSHSVSRPATTVRHFFPSGRVPSPHHLWHRILTIALSIELRTSTLLWWKFRRMDRLSFSTAGLAKNDRYDLKVYYWCAVGGTQK